MFIEPRNAIYAYDVEFLSKCKDMKFGSERDLPEFNYHHKWSLEFEGTKFAKDDKKWTTRVIWRVCTLRSKKVKSFN